MTTQTAAPADRPATTGEPPGRGSRTPLRVLAIGLSLLLVAYGAVVLASLLSRETRTSSASFDGIRTVQLDTSFESVEVVATPGATSVDLDRRWTWSLHEPSVSARQVGDRLVVSSGCSFSPGLPCTGRVRLAVPEDVRVVGGSSDGHLLLSGLTGDLDVHNADGGVELRDVTGTLRLSTSDGSVDATGLTSRTVVVDTSDGSVRLSFANPPDSVRASTSDGSLEVVVPDDGTPYAVAVSVSDGSQQVDVPTDPGSAHRITVHTSDGSVRILPAG
jgi:hypothetical protein